MDSVKKAKMQNDSSGTDFPKSLKVTNSYKYIESIVKYQLDYKLTYNFFDYLAL